MQEDGAARGDFFAGLKSRINALSASEQKLARYALEHPERVQAMTGAALAEACGVSKATLTRCVRRLGYASYRAFQIDAARAGCGAGGGMAYSDIGDGDTAETVCRKVFENGVRSLMETQSLIDPQKMDEALNMLLDCRALYVFAQGRSAVVSRSLVNRFYRLGMHCVESSDPQTQAVYSSLAGPGDVVIGISTYGRSRSVLRAMERAKAAGARVLGLTSFRDTPINRHAHCVLCAVADHKTGREYEPSCETVSQILLVDCLYMMLIGRRKALAKQCFLKTQGAIEDERI